MPTRESIELLCTDKFERIEELLGSVLRLRTEAQEATERLEHTVMKLRKRSLHAESTNVSTRCMFAFEVLGEVLGGSLKKQRTSRPNIDRLEQVNRPEDDPESYQYVLDKVVAKTIKGMEKMLVPRRTPVSTPKILRLTEKDQNGLILLGMKMQNYEKHKFQQKDRDDILYYIRHKTCQDFDGTGKYSLLHCFRTIEQWWYQSCGMGAVSLSERWIEMSDCVKEMTKLLKSEDINSARDLVNAVSKEMGVREWPFTIISQFDIQLILCHTRSVIDEMRRIPLNQLEDAPWVDTLRQLGGDPCNVFHEPRLLYDELKGTFTFSKSPRRENSVVKVIAALIKGGFFVKAELGNAADVKAFLRAADMIRAKKHGGLHLYRLLIVCHQLWVPSRMMAFANGIQSSRRTSKSNSARRRRIQNRMT